MRLPRTLLLGYSRMQYAAVRYLPSQRSVAQHPLPKEKISNECSSIGRLGANW